MNEAMAGFVPAICVLGILSLPRPKLEIDGARDRLFPSLGSRLTCRIVAISALGNNLPLHLFHADR
jgi:hypothetical protein